MRISLALISYKQWKKERSRRRRIRVRGRREDLAEKMIGGRIRRKEEDMNLVKKVIPFDVQVEILMRLPCKSLMRFKCVSKLWYSLIRSRFFANLYLKPPQTPRMYMSLVDHNHHWDNPKGCVLMSLSSSNNAKSFHEDLTIPGKGGYMMVVFRGLLFYNVSGDAACIFNPSTRQILTLPTIGSNIFPQQGCRKSVSYFLGHDPVLDQYKVLCNIVIYAEDFGKIITSEHWVLVLEPGSCWRRIECDQLYLPTRLGLCINGVIYFVAPTSMSQSYVVSFNVRNEEFTIIQVPHVVSGLFVVTDLIEYGGKPTILDHTHFIESGLVDLWVLEDFGKWLKKSIVLKPCQMHLIDKFTTLVVQGTTNKGEVILAPFPLFSHYYVLDYDLHNNHLRKVRIRGIPKHWFRSDYSFCFNLTLMDECESILHLEI